MKFAPTFYEKDKDGISQSWCALIKNTIAKVAVNFTTTRMLTDYENQYYFPMSERVASLKQDNFALAIQISDWKRKVNQEWDNVKIVSTEIPNKNKQLISIGNNYQAKITLDIGGLNMNDIGLELVIAREDKEGKTKVMDKKEFTPASQEGSNAVYTLEVVTEYPGSLQLGLRVFPKNDLLPHRQDFALVKWF